MKTSRFRNFICDFRKKIFALKIYYFLYKMFGGKSKKKRKRQIKKKKCKERNSKKTKINLRISFIKLLK